VFRNLNPELFGVDQLSKKLTTVLVTRIKKELVRREHVFSFIESICCARGSVASSVCV
jgi:hypothetical protein